MRTEHVVVLPYNLEWKEWFRQLKSFFNKFLKEHIISIEHVGSTSVPGLAAKSIIDLDIVIERKNFNTVKTILEAHNFAHEGDLGIPDREAFKSVDPQLKTDLPPHHLYVCPKNSTQLHHHLVFRNYLRSNPSAKKEYGNLKLRLAKKHPFDIDAYMQGKNRLVKQILKQALESQ